MTTRKPKTDVYIPQPDKWNWETLSDTEVGNRLRWAVGTQVKLESWASDLRRQQEEAWQALRARLPEAKMYETKTAMARIEDMGKQLKATEKDLARVTAAIRVIRENCEVLEVSRG